jgi:hypothetical protein
MDYAIGIALALVVAGFAAFAGFDRDRAFYPTVLVIIASYYVLFAVISGSMYALLVESAIMTFFAALSVLGFRTSLWIVAAALAGHAVFDTVHGFLLTNPGVPVWWPGFCLAYDLTAAGAMVWLLKHRPASAKELWQTGT